MNWYQTDGTYSGGVSDFQTGWKVLSKAIEEHAPETKMYWSPNIGSDSDYEKYYPQEGRVDIVGVSCRSFPALLSALGACVLMK